MKLRIPVMGRSWGMRTNLLEISKKCKRVKCEKMNS